VLGRAVAPPMRGFVARRMLGRVQALRRFAARSSTRRTRRPGNPWRPDCRHRGL